MRIVIVGAGAIGRFFGGMLRRSGNEVIFVESNPEVVNAINENGVQFIRPGEDQSNVTLRVKARATGEPDSVDACDLIILAVKGYTTAAAVRRIAMLVRDDAPLLTIQTGLGNIETMAEILDKKNLLGGVTFHGATSLDESRVRHAGSGKTLIGELHGRRSERLFRIKELFYHSGIETEISDNIIGHIWAKSLVYSAINPLTAILRLKNGQIVEKMESISLARRLIDEGKVVAQAYAVQLPDDDLYDSLLVVCRSTAENLSPMLQDLLNNRPTEIETLNGMIFSLGRRKGISTPLHQAMTDLIRLLAKWGSHREFGP
ncbi:MAG: 2-dehydropantoate 2-reductase [Deltaproteobacteria bacterium]|nr:2-dehydropantoate 2-reductase [Deltaproteobacteria bacterium]